MLHRTGNEGLRHDRHGLSRSVPGVSSKVLLAVAPQPRLGNPTRWGWPHWLAPAYQAGGQHPAHRPLEEYG